MNEIKRDMVTEKMLDFVAKYVVGNLDNLAIITDSVMRNNRLKNAVISVTKNGEDKATVISITSKKKTEKDFRIGFQ